jgi:hypothetical protein
LCLVFVRLLALIVLTLCFAACNGGTVDKHALTNDSATIASIACEGALLAHDVSSGRTTANFTREQAEELQIQASNLADALGSRPTSASIESRVRAAGARAARISQTIARLQGDPANKGLAAFVEQRLARLGGCA